MKRFIPLAIFIIAAVLLLAHVIMSPNDTPAVYENATMVMLPHER